MPNILVVDDSPLMRKLVPAHLNGMHDLHVSAAGDAVEALRLMQENRFDLVITDMHLEQNGMGGAGLVRSIRKIHGESMPIVVMSTDEESAEVTAAMHFGANEFLKKPFTGRGLQNCIGKFLESTIDGVQLH